MASLNDPQREKVYSFERGLTTLLYKTGPPELTETKIVKLVRHAWSIYFPFSQGSVAPTVIFRKSKRAKCFYRAWEHDITLQSWGRNIFVVLHEVAHGIMEYASRHWYAMSRPWSDGSSKCQSHGPEFVRVFVALLARHGVFDLNMMTEYAAKWSVNVASPDLAPETWRKRVGNQIESDYDIAASEYGRTGVSST